jgi:hypothetical protein
MTDSVALGQFVTIFTDVATAMVPFIVPMFVIVWVIRLAAELLRGKS